MTFGQSAFRLLTPDVTHGAGEETVDLFLTVEANVPVRLSTASVDMASPEQTLTPVMTYDFFDFERRPPPEDAFRMKVRAVLGQRLAPARVLGGPFRHHGMHCIGTARERRTHRAWRTKL